MNTASVVTEVVRLNPDWTRPQVRDVINNLVKLFLKTPLDSQVYIDTTTGELPYLSTTAGTYNYSPTISGVSLWGIKEIVVDADDASAIDFDLPNDDADREWQELRFLGRLYNVVPTKKNNEEGSTGPSVTFRIDPGTKTSLYRLMAWETPSEITSDSVEIPIDDRHRYTIVMPAIQSVIDGLDNGRYVEAMQYVSSTLVPKLRWAVENKYNRTTTVNYQY